MSGPASGGHENPVKAVKAGRSPSVKSREDVAETGDDGPSSARGREKSVPSAPRKRGKGRDVETLERGRRGDLIVSLGP